VVSISSPDTTNTGCTGLFADSSSFRSTFRLRVAEYDDSTSLIIRGAVFEVAMRKSTHSSFMGTSVRKPVFLNSRCYRICSSCSGSARSDLSACIDGVFVTGNASCTAQHRWTTVQNARPRSLTCNAGMLVSPKRNLQNHISSCCVSSHFAKGSVLGYTADCLP